MKGLINSVEYADGLRVGEVAIPDISEVLKQPGRFVWVGLHEPDEEMLAEIQQEFSLHDLAVEDAARAPAAQARAVRQLDLRRAAHRPHRSGDRRHRLRRDAHLRGRELRRLGPARRVAAVQRRAHALRGHARSLDQGAGLRALRADGLHRRPVFPAVDRFEDKLGELEDNIFQQTLTRETTERIYQLKRDLLEVKRAVAPLVDICNRLVRTDATLIPDDARVYFRDVYDHTIRINEMIDTLRELLTTALEANLSLISVSQNEAMKRLAGWAAIIAVPTLIAASTG